ncbi:MAG: winged helix-turn-helix domain-containing protein [Pseudomonadota bacterium]
MTDSVFEFGGFHLDSTRRLLFGANGESIPLNSRAFDTLLFLIEHRGELLDKATLMQAIWPNTVVEENNLNQSIFALRRVLGEAPGDHRFIVTVPGRGYRFVASVDQRDNVPRTGRPAVAVPLHSRRYLWLASLAAPVLALAIGLLADRREEVAAMAPATVTRPNMTASIAVLPFLDMSEGHTQEYLSDGIAEEVMNQLGKLPGLRVVGRTSAFSFKGRSDDLRRIGRTLGVNHILEGSVRRSGNRIRVTAQLVNAQTGTQLWSQTFDRQLGDVIAVQDEIAHSVAGSLRVALSGPATVVASPP